MISVITVNYNNSESLNVTLNNLKEQINIKFELVIIDGGSSDNSVSVVNEYEEIVTKFVSEPDSGIYNAMNKGIGFAKGDYIIFMNAGDTFIDENTFSEIEKEMTENPGFDIYYSDAIYTKSDFEYTHHADSSLLMSKMPFNHQSAVIKRILHEEILYNEFYRISSDYDFFLRAHKRSATFHKLKTKIARHSLDGISVTSPFHSCLESVHAHLMNFRKIEFKNTEYYGEFFIKEIFRTTPLLSKLVVILYTFFVKGNKRAMLKTLIRKAFR
ncbi:glycosyltransferase family 2 protein [Vibrio hepatarius]|uniref:glycosyltransferase family 2 protein n=1 Tax=Vibrio hepatarius TaxID=171383 RepID=UPI003735D5E2